MYALKNILPGYLWIFHHADGTANVGIGLIASIINKKKINLNTCFENLLQREPLKSRLAAGVRMETVKGHIIPLGGERREISGNRFLLAGDAAGLVDPFSGEGVGNAIRSGRVAAEHITACFRENDFSAEFNRSYDREIYRRMLSEFRFHKQMRTLFSNPSLLNYFIGATARHHALENSLMKAFMNLQGNKRGQALQFILQLIYLYTFKHFFLFLSHPFRKE